MSLYVAEHDLGFLHIPRTAGTWVGKAMRSLGLRTSCWPEIQPTWIPRNHRLMCHLHDPPNPRLIFTIVRHPIAYYESVWKWLDAHQEKPFMRRWRWHPSMSAWRQYRKDESFSCWVDRMLSAEPCWYTRMIESYVGPEGAEFVDYIGRTCSVERDLLDVLNIAGVRVGQLRNVPPKNAISRALVWRKDQLGRVLDSERLMICRFYEGSNSTRRLYARLA